MQYLLDTNVLSALRVRGRHRSVEVWSAAVAVADQFVAATVIAEIERGIVSKERADPAQGDILRRWFEGQLLPAFAGRVLPFDLPAVRVLASYRVPEHAPPGVALIAAVAESSGMIVVTRNTRHFEPLGVACLNPWVERPDSPSDR